jgi:hypothetical protein
MKIEELKNLLKRTPVILQSDPIALAYLENTRVVKDLHYFVGELDSPVPTKSEGIIILDDNPRYSDRFPVVEVTEDLFKPRLNELLFNKYNFLSNNLFTQKNIADLVISDANNKDVIVLFLIDGLSYYDCRDIESVKPCFVNGATITETGFQNIIGDPTLAHRLFEEGFKSRLGFSYWNRNNELTNLLFKGFAGDQMYQVSEYASILETLEQKSLEKTFIQIVVEGCDEVAHKSRDRPPIKQFIKRIFKEHIPRLTDILHDKGLKGVIHLVADHGIWWKTSNNKEKCIILSDPRTSSKRFLNGHIIRNDVLQVECYGKRYSLLKYPYLFNDYAVNEWGTHGGISFYECFVPYYKKEINK